MRERRLGVNSLDSVPGELLRAARRCLLDVLDARAADELGVAASPSPETPAQPTRPAPSHLSEPPEEAHHGIDYP